MHRHPIRPALSIALLLAAAMPAQDDPKVVSVLKDGEITLSTEASGGMPLADFVDLASRVTGKVIIYTEQEIGNTTVAFVGRVKLQKSEFFSFFQTMLYIKGFACVLRGGGNGEVVEIVNMQGPKRNEVGASARYVPPDEIARYADQAGTTILTSIALEHINAQIATQALRPFFSQSGAGPQGLIPGNVGDGRSLLLQGFGPQVHAAHQLLRLVDRPETDDTEFRLVRLAHARAEQLEPIVTQLLAERAHAMGAGVTAQGMPAREPLQVIAYGALDALLLDGPRPQVLHAVDVIARLDVPVETGGGDVHLIRLQNARAEVVARTLRSFLREDEQAERSAQSGQRAPAAGAARRPAVVVAHPESNDLLVSASQAKFKEIERIVAELDVVPPDPTRAVRLEIDGDSIVLSIAGGEALSAREFIELAHEVTGKVFTFAEVDFARDPRAALSLVGTMRMKRAGFFEFFVEMLQTRGYECVPHGEGDTQFIEVQKARPPKPGSTRAAESGR